MLSVNDREWKEFLVKSVFVTERKNKKLQIPTGANIKKEELKPGDIPRITVTSQNNGIYGYYRHNDKVRVFKNFISVSFLGNVFYHPYTASLDMKVHCLKLINRQLNGYIAKFLVVVLKQNTSKYSYGDQLSSTDLPNKKILLPVDTHGNPDYAFMEEYIKEREIAKKKEYLNYCTGQIKRIGTCKTVHARDFAAFYIDDLFEIKSGKRFIANKMHPGKRPFIGAADSGNGVTNFVSDMNGSLDRNVLGVNYDGNGMVISFYHPYECIFSDSVKRFHLKYSEDNMFVMLYLKTIILQQKSKYNYGYKFNANRMARQIIMLPVNGNGDPDYDYMEQYGRRLMLQKYRQYLNFYIGV